MATQKRQRAWARARYEGTHAQSVVAIAEAVGVGEMTVYRWAREGGWRRRAPEYARPRDRAREAEMALRRAQGWTLAAIGEAMTPPVTRQRVQQLLKRMAEEA